MLTQEQINNLKEGDPLIVNVSLKRIDEDGDIWVTAPCCSSGWFTPDRVSIPSEHGTLVPTPKYDPCRFFRKGDRVRIKREINGRKLNHVFVNFSYDQTYTGSFYELELVTPVEELEPYSVGESSHTWYVYKDNDVVVAFNKENYPNAKAAAEAECARLNAEWRKEREND